jgi:hypothetical protein
MSDECSCDQAEDLSQHMIAAMAADSERPAWRRCLQQIRAARGCPRTKLGFIAPAFGASAGGPPATCVMCGGLGLTDR